MKTLAKLSVVSACILVGMTSCLKNSDPDFGISGIGAYILQQNEVSSTDTVATFAPYIIFSANQPLAKASVTCPSYVLGVNGKITNNYYWESNVPAYEYKQEMEDESYTITATNANGEKAIYTFQLGIDKSKAIGEFDAKFTYDSQSGLTVKWDPAKNANFYELVARESENPTIKGTVATTSSQHQITFTNYDASNAGLKSGTKYDFELVAYTKENNVITVKLKNRTGKNQFTVNSWGTNNSGE